MVGSAAPRKKMPGKPAVSKPSLGLRRSVEPSMRSVPVRSLLTKKTAPPPSLAWLSSMIVPAMSKREGVAVGVDGAAAAAAGRAGPGRVGARCRSAVLWLNTLLSTTHETPMLLSPPPFEHSPPSPGAPPKVLLTT